MPAPPERYTLFIVGRLRILPQLSSAQSSVTSSGHAEAAFVILLNLFIERPQLGDLRYIGIDLLSQHFALGGHNLLRQRDPFLGRANHGGIVLTPKTDSVDIFEVFALADSLTPEVVEDIGLGGVVPVAVGRPPITPAPKMPVPFLLGAHHGFLMAGAHDNPVFIREPGISGIVFGKRVVPHGGPQIIALHTQDDLEDSGVECAVEVRGRAAGHSVFSKFGADPEIEIGLFVIEEDAAVFDAGLTLLILARPNV